MLYQALHALLILSVNHITAKRRVLIETGSYVLLKLPPSRMMAIDSPRLLSILTAYGLS